MGKFCSLPASSRPILYFLLAALLHSCGGNKSDSVTVKGDLNNLPSGYVVLRSFNPDGWHTIDSVENKNGKFEFNLSAAQYPEPILVGISHYDTVGIKRPIIFSTGVTAIAGVGGIEATSDFYLENGVEMNGSVKVQDTGWYKTIQANQPIQACPQSRVMYEDTAGFKMITNVNKAVDLIKQHPYSHYYLESLERRAPKLSNAQFYTLFSAFDREVRESETGVKMKQYVDARSR